LKKAGEILAMEADRPKTNRKRLISLARDRFGESAIHFVEDINRHVKTGRKRDTTWAIGKDKIAKRRVRNTMGYMAPTDDEDGDK
jgi:hypothetical protein